MKYLINQLFLILFFLVQTVYVNGCEADHQVDLFIQKFPRLTFPQTKKHFAKLTDTQQARVWDKLNTNEKDRHKILPLALFMAQIEPLLQYAILSENFTILEKRKSDESVEDYNKRINIPHKIHSHSIYGLFRWKAVIDKKCNEKNRTKIWVAGKYYPTNPSLKISKLDLFGLSIDHINAIENLNKEALLKKGLRLLNELSDEFLAQLKPDDGLHIKFFYREPFLHTIVKNTLDQLPFILLPLLYAHFYINPVWDAVTGTQDLLALNRNMQMELHNTVIDDLQKKFINGSEHLIKQIIRPVPFDYTLSDYFTLFKPTILMSGINAMLLCIIRFKWDQLELYKCRWDQGRRRITSKPFNLSTLKSLYLFKQFLLDEGIIVFLNLIPGFLLSIPISCIASFFSKALGDVLPTLVVNATMSVILIVEVFNIIGNRIEPQLNYWKYINFSKEKFKNKSVKECIEYYLNHPRIVIVD